MDTVIGGAEWIIRVGSKFNHCQICDIYKMLAIVIALIYREAFFDGAYIVVLCLADLASERTVAKVAHQHSIFAVCLKLRTRLKPLDFFEGRSGLYGRKNARLFEQSGAEVVMDGFHLRTGSRHRLRRCRFLRRVGSCFHRRANALR